MTLFAVICAAIFPGIHVGRFWMAWYMAPIPNNWGIWQNFRSALMWDVFAVSTYFTVSVLFWYTGLVPDLATLRDRATTRIRKFLFGIFALGWRGSNRHWRHYEMAYLLLAGLSTPLVLSVHSVVSFDFATSILPTWHTTIFPPYFVAGAIFGGFAMVLTLMLPARALYKLHDIITPQHIDKMAKIILLTGSIVTYAYAMEFFLAWYSGNHYERFAFWKRVLPEIDPDSNGFAIETQMSVRALKARLRIAEVPSFERRRIHGKSNLRALPDGWMILKTILRERTRGRRVPAKPTVAVGKPAVVRHWMP